MARYDPEWVRSFYDEYAEREWARWDESPVQQMKFAVHLHYLRRYLDPSDRILDMGAGAGRFTQELAKISDRIVVADISPAQLELNRANARALGFAGPIERWVECDMCDLRSHFRDEEFDAVVCYGGPLSYVFGERDEALRELLRVTQAGGVLLLGVMSLWGTVHHFLPGVLEVDIPTNRKIIASGDLSPESMAASHHCCHMYRAAELREFLEGAGVVIEVLSASDCLSATWAEPLRTLRRDQDAWQHLLEMELEACREPGCVDMGTHLIAVCRKM
jgi:ubiquinone/menaquinone biosynthesis C-methylase UbiE